MTIAASGIIGDNFLDSCRNCDNIRTKANNVTKKTRNIDIFSSYAIIVNYCIRLLPFRLGFFITYLLAFDRGIIVVIVIMIVVLLLIHSPHSLLISVRLIRFDISSSSSWNVNKKKRHPRKTNINKESKRKKMIVYFTSFVY